MSYDDYYADCWDGYDAPSRRKDTTGVFGDTAWRGSTDSLYTRCTQKTWWTDAGGTTWKLEEMTPIHRQNLVAWLNRRANAMHEWAFGAGKISYRDRNLSAQEWFGALPLVKALIDLSYCPTCGNVI